MFNPYLLSLNPRLNRAKSLLKQAKLAKKKDPLKRKLHVHQEQLARENGFANWQAYTQREKHLKTISLLRNKLKAQSVAMSMRLPIKLATRRLQRSIESMKQYDLKKAGLNIDSKPLHSEAEKTSSSYIERLNHAKLQTEPLKLK